MIRATVSTGWNVTFTAKRSRVYGEGKVHVYTENCSAVVIADTAAEAIAMLMAVHCDAVVYSVTKKGGPEVIFDDEKLVPVNG